MYRRWAKGICIGAFVSAMFSESKKKKKNNQYKCTIQADTNVAETVTPSHLWKIKIWLKK